MSVAVLFVLNRENNLFLRKSPNFFKLYKTISTYKVEVVWPIRLNFVYRDRQNLHIN